MDTASTSYRSPRGTRDILPADQPVWEQIYTTAREIARRFSYAPLSTPTYEELGLFERSIGAGTDVIDKELFLVKGKGSDWEGEGSTLYALRPEGTAGFVRAFIEHGMHTWPQPVKLYGFVNLFRYDRPQRGRYREHIQFDFEYFGDHGPFADAWVIYTGWAFFQALGLSGITLSLNTLGTAAERRGYEEKLVAFATANRDRLSEDSQQRLATNPLRILDSKDPADQALRAEAPTLTDYLQQLPDRSSWERFQTVQTYLANWQIPVTLDPFLVRGLDYYAHTAFEWVRSGALGQQSSLGGGGRYDGLLTQLGGPDVGAVGQGIGLDRVVEAYLDQQLAVPAAPTPAVYVALADPAAARYAQEVIAEVTGIGLAVEAAWGRGSLGSQLKHAAKVGARYAVIIGGDEMNDQSITLRNLADGSQETVSRSTAIERLRPRP